VSRRPKPTAIKELEGNPGGRPMNDMEPKPPKGVPEMPKELRPTAQREWRIMSGHLDMLGVLSVIDGKALAMYCDAYADWEVAQRKCVKDGMWTEEPIISKDGNLCGYKYKQAPWFNVKVTSQKVMKSYLIEFGMTPASRSKLKIERPKTTDDFPGRGDTHPSTDDLDLNAIHEELIQ